MKHPKEGSCDITLKLPHSLPRIFPSDQENMVRYFSSFAHHLFLLFLYDQHYSFQIFRKVTIHIVGDSGITSAWVTFFALYVPRCVRCEINDI